MTKRGVDSSCKAQFSMEYLMMMGFALLLLIPTIFLFATESENIKSDIAMSHATQVARKIADKAEEVYYQGEPSRTTIKVNIPQGIENITFDNKEIIIYLRNPDNVILAIIESSPVNITGNVSSKEGVHFIQIKSEGDYVSVSET